MTPEDKENFLARRNSDLNRAVSLSQEVIDSSQHELWFKGVLAAAESMAFALEFRNGIVFFFTVSMTNRVGKVGAIRACDGLPHPALGALMPLIALEAGFLPRKAEYVQTDVLLTNLPVLRARRILRLDDIGSVVTDGHTVRQVLSRDEFDLNKESLWGNANNKFGEIAQEVRNSCSIEDPSP